MHASDLVWAMGSCCALHGKPFDPQLLLKQYPPPYSPAILVRAARSLGFQARLLSLPLDRLSEQTAKVFTVLKPAGREPALGLLASLDATTIHWIPAGTHEPQVLLLHEFAARYAGEAVLVQPLGEAVNDPDRHPGRNSFGFAWFIPELLRHRKVWRDVLGASLLLQLLALGLPLFTQAIIDKVIVHRTQSTLIALAVGMAIFMVFTAILTWVRQYLVLHTGNRVDAVLGQPCSITS